MHYKLYWQNAAILIFPLSLSFLLAVHRWLMVLRHFLPFPSTSPEQPECACTPADSLSALKFDPQMTV